LTLYRYKLIYDILGGHSAIQTSIYLTYNMNSIDTSVYSDGGSWYPEACSWSQTPTSFTI
jgi:hypothetical protein